jgi:hypothetical protein
VDRWFGQVTHVSVWCEKEALSGVFQKPCDELGVGLFACKGYPSHSALWQWLKGLETAYDALSVVQDNGERLFPDYIPEAVVLYFGDHDPDGWQIPRSAEETVNTLAQVHNLQVPPIRFERIALNMDQIQKYNPPPFAAKMTSSRYKSYVQEHGLKDAWELDALDIKVLDALIHESVNEYWDSALHQEWQDRAELRREQLREKMREKDWVQNIL